MAKNRNKRRLDLSKRKKSNEIFELSMTQKYFLCKKYSETKSIPEVQNEYEKMFPEACVPSKYLILQLYVGYMKGKNYQQEKPIISKVTNNNTVSFFNDVSPFSTNIINSASTMSSREYSPQTSCQNFLLKKRKKKNKGKKKRYYDMQVTDSTVKCYDHTSIQTVSGNTKCKNAEWISINTNAPCTSSGSAVNTPDCANMELMANNDTPTTTVKNECKLDILHVSDKNNLVNKTTNNPSNVCITTRIPETATKPETNCVLPVNSKITSNQPPTSDGIDDNCNTHSIFNDSTILMESTNSNRTSQNTNSDSTSHAVPQLEKYITVTKKKKIKNKNTLNSVRKTNRKKDLINRVSNMYQNIRLKSKETFSRDKKNLIKKVNSQNTPKIDLTNDSVSTSTAKYPDSSTPYKCFHANSNNNKISISPISSEKGGHKSIAKEPIFETIVEISDDENEISGKYTTVDEIGYTFKKQSNEEFITLDKIDCGESQNTGKSITSCSLNDSTIVLDTVVENKGLGASLTETNQRVQICYDLTADDTDVSGNSLEPNKLALLEDNAAAAETFKPLSNKKTRNYGSNIYNPLEDTNEIRTGLRLIVIDGSNVAFAHGMKKHFSVEGIQICIEYFAKRGHEVKAFVPRFRSKMHKSTNPLLLQRLEDEGLVVFTPSRQIEGKYIISYDDRFIVQFAAQYEGIVVSTDNYRDLLQENPSWRQTINERLLPFTFVGNLLMFPQDPLGRNGPDLKTFLSHKT